MATIEINDQELKINVKGLDRLLAFKGSVTIALAHIKSAEVYTDGFMDFKHATFGIGTIFAHKIQAGTFSENGAKSFWDVHDINKTIVLTLTDEEYSKVIIEVQDPLEAIKEIQDKIA